jgi:hypothetical protein
MSKGLIQNVVGAKCMISQCLIEELVGAHCTSVPTFDSVRPHRTTARITSLSPTMQQPLSMAIQGTSIINTDVHIFGYQNRAVLQEERQHA